MRLIDDKAMLEMLDQGLSQKQVAGHFKVSEAAVSKRLKRLRSYQLPDSFERLTSKQQKFAISIAEGKSQTTAAMEAFDCADRTSGKALGSRMMKDPDVSVAIQDLLHQEGLGRRKRIRRLKALVMSKDLSVAGKGLDMAFKIAGEYAPEQVDIKARWLTIHADIEAVRALMKEREAQKSEVEQKLTASDDPDI
jgi:predicted transcriptional regulator